VKLKRVLSEDLKRQPNETPFDYAWRKTKSWEGKWVDEPTSYTQNGKSKDEGNYYNNVFYGTTFGLTPKMMIEFRNWKVSDLKKLQTMSESDAKGHWKTVVWDWLLRGDKITDVEVAALLFDTLVHNQNRFLFYFNYKKVCDNKKTLLTTGWLLSWLKSKKNAIDSDYIEGYKYHENGGQPGTSGGFKLTEKAIALINEQISLKGGKVVFNDIKSMRKEAEKKWSYNAAKKTCDSTDWAINRQTAYEYGMIQENTEWGANKLTNNVASNYRILFFTQKGCAPCIQKKPLVQALAAKYNIEFEEVDIRTDNGKILMTQYRIAMTPEVVLTDGSKFKSFGAAELPDKLEAALTPNNTNSSDENNRIMWLLLFCGGMMFLKD
jgi:thiol-disulfide isomerase/thioredoxin